MTVLSARQNMPDTAKPTVDLIERFGFKPKFEYEYPRPSLGKRVQIREVGHVAPKAEVNKYAAAFIHGDKFPPSIMTRDGYIVDGNTRIGAAEKNKYPTIQALILDEDYEGAPENVRIRIHALGAAFNVRNGKGIDRNEIRQAIEIIGENRDYDATRIASLLGVTENTVRMILAEKRVRDRASQLGIHLNGKLKPGQLRKIGSADKSINEGPFRELLALAEDAGLSPNEIAAIIKKMKEAKSDKGALDVLATEREARREQIAEHKATGKARPPYPAKLRQSLGFLLKYKEPSASLEELVENNPNLRVDHACQLNQAILLLTQLAELQSEADATA